MEDSNRLSVSDVLPAHPPTVGMLVWRWTRRLLVLGLSILAGLICYSVSGLSVADDGTICSSLLFNTAPWLIVPLFVLAFVLVGLLGVVGGWIAGPGALALVISVGWCFAGIRGGAMLTWFWRGHGAMGYWLWIVELGIWFVCWWSTVLGALWLSRRVHSPGDRTEDPVGMPIWPDHDLARAFWRLVHGLCDLPLPPLIEEKPYHAPVAGAITVLVGLVGGWMVLQVPDVWQIVVGLGFVYLLGGILAMQLVPTRYTHFMFLAPWVVALLGYLRVALGGQTTDEMLTLIYRGRFVNIALAMPIVYASAGMVGVLLGRKRGWDMLAGKSRELAESKVKADGSP